MTHTLKIWPEYYAAVRDGRKTFEVRRNDRDYRPGDVLVLQEWNPQTEQYTGEETTVCVIYVSDCRPFIPEGIVVMSIEQQ